MDIVAKKSITRYLVELSVDEVSKLSRAVYQIDPSRRLWLSRQELDEVCLALGWSAVPEPMMLALDSAPDLSHIGPAMEGWCTVHVLLDRHPLCRFTAQPPTLWGEDRWVHVVNAHDEQRRVIEQRPRARICETCWQRAKEIRDASPVRA